MELVTALGLSVSSGLNAYIPLLLVGLLARFTEAVPLPSAWAWLSDPWVLAVLAVLLTIEVVADKVPAVDTVNDVLQTAVRPTSGGIVVGAAGWGGEATVTDPQSFLADGGWVPLLSGAVVALAVHLAKASLRAAANAATAGFAAPVLSTAEDVTAVGLTLAAILVPVLALVILALLVWWFVRARRRRAAARAAAQTP
jgi:H+/gluconate symporter-like permease